MWPNAAARTACVAPISSQNACGRLGLTLRRFKTGTPARVNARSIDFSQLELSGGGRGCSCPSPLRPRSPRTTGLCCHITYTNEKTHAIIRANLDRSPLYDGIIEGIGPRYCPSIED